MDRGMQVRQAAASVWDRYRALTGSERLTSELPLLDLIIDIAENVCRITVAPDDTFIGTNVQGEAIPSEKRILYRSDLTEDRATFVIAHELGHIVLQHQIYRFLDTEKEIDEGVSADTLSEEHQQGLIGLDLTPGMLQNLRGYSERVTCELEANAFATALLAPHSLIRQLVLADPQIQVAALAARLRVSPGHIYLALSSGLLKGRLADEPPPPDSAHESPSLDPRQQEAVAVMPPARIIAGPGAGKTRVLVERFARLVTEGVEPKRILALTFANKAAGEMRERLVQRVTPELAPAIEVSTFHAFGLMLLQEYGHHLELMEQGEPLRLVTRLDALLMLRPYLNELKLGSFAELRGVLRNVRNLLAAVSRAKDEDAGPERWQELVTESEGALYDVGQFYQEYQARLIAAGCLDYADLIYQALKVLKLPGIGDAIRAQYDHILVDEFQDINYSSGLLVKALDGGRQIVWAVGDPRQSIYGFRGASPVNLGRFTEYYPGAQTIHLDRNYRSLADIVTAGQQVPIPYSGDPEIAPVPLKAARGYAEQPSVEWALCGTMADELRFLVEQLSTLSAQGIPLSDIAVLCRKTKHAQQVADALTRVDIAHTWGGKLEDRHLFKVLYGALLLAADDPQGIVSLTTLIPLYGIVKQTTPQYPLSEPDRRALMSVHRNYRRNRRPSARALLIAAASEDIEGMSPAGRATCRELLHLADSLSAKSRPHHNLSIYLFEYAAWFRELLTPELQESFAGRRARATLGQIFDLAASFALRGISGEDVSTRAFLSYLRAAIDSGGLDTTDDLPPGGEAVAVLTAHRSKGLEWPVVFVPFAAEGTYPLKERDPEVELPPGMAHTLDTDDTHLRDEACLFYVAITRARNRLVLSYAQKYGARKLAVSPFVTSLLTTMRAQGRLLEHPLTLGTLDDADDMPIVNGGGPENGPWPLGDEVGEFLLKTYLSCPRRFAFTCIYGIEDEDRAYRSFQRVVFEAAQDPANFEALWEEHGPSADHWQTPFLHHKAQRLLQQATGPLAGADSPCVKHQQTRSIRLGATEDGRERRTTMKIHREQEKPDGGLAISYINTSGKPPRNTPDDDRFVLYSLYASEVAPDKSNEISIEYIETGESRPATFTPLVQRNRQKKLLKAIQAIELGDMAPRQASGCGGCPYIPLCSVGKKTDF